MTSDDGGDLQDAIRDVEWLHGHWEVLPAAARHDFKDAMGLIREFSRSVRIIRLIDQNHVRSEGYRIRARTL